MQEFSRELKTILLTTVRVHTTPTRFRVVPIASQAAAAAATPAPPRTVAPAVWPSRVPMTRKDGEIRARANRLSGIVTTRNIVAIIALRCVIDCSLGFLAHVF